MKLEPGDIENILHLGDDEIYRATRYKLPLTLVLIKTDAEFDTINKEIRQSDLHQQITTNVSCVYLTHTSEDESYRFIQKLKAGINFSFVCVTFNGSKREFKEELSINCI